MKKTLLVGVLALMGSTVMAQSGTGFGIKAGLNYNKNGDLIGSVGESGQDIVEGAESKTGYHIGFWGKLDLPKIYLRPELVYTKTKSSYMLSDSDIADDTQDYDISKLDLPILLGVKIIGPLHLFAGPAFQYTLKNDLDGVEIEDVENDFTVGLNAGFGVNISRVGFDIRYERGFSKNEAEFIGNNVTDVSGRVDSRPSQVIFSLSLKL